MLPTTILSQLALCSAHRRCKNEGVQTARRGVYKKNEDGYHDRRSFMNHHLGSFHSTVTNIQRTSLCSPSDFDGMLFFLWCVVPRLRSSRGHCWVDRTRYAQSGEVWGCIFSLTLFSAILLPINRISPFSMSIAFSKYCSTRCRRSAMSSSLFKLTRNCLPEALTKKKTRIC